MTSTINFTSLNNPIKPFKVSTTCGDIVFKEIDYKKSHKPKEFTEVSEFFVDNFAKNSSYPFFEKCRKDLPTYDKSVSDDYIRLINSEINRCVKDADTTLLIGRDKDNKIAGAIITEALDCYAGAKSTGALYIDMLAVNPKYRKSHIGLELCNKVMESSKEDFKDCMLLAYNEAVPFYEKQGFKQLEFNEETKEAFKFLNNLGLGEYPDYTTCMTKPLDKSSSRWWSKV